MRQASLKVCLDKKKGRYYYSMPPHLSETGSRKRFYFKDERVAKEELSKIQKERECALRLVQQTSPERLGKFIQWDEELKHFYGVADGLGTLFEEFVVQKKREHESRKFGSLAEDYETARSSNWTKKTRSTWKWFLRLVEPLKDKSVVSLDLQFWEQWINELKSQRDLSARSSNDVLARLSSVWKHAVLRGLVEKNPIDGVVRLKTPSKAPDVLSVKEARKILDCAWTHDREIVPYFALAIFAGLRPDYAKNASEITKLRWEDVDFDSKEIKVGANLDNKTGTKRFVELLPNLASWLSDWKGQTGEVCPVNLRKRVEDVLSGRHMAAADSVKSDWVPLIDMGKNRQDIFRHTFGSFYAVGRTSHQVREAMGHTNDKTFNQFYRNAQSSKDAEAFWSIFPPTE